MAEIVPLPVRVFTLNDRCTKVEIWNAFNGDHRPFAPVVEARGIIGERVPTHMLNLGRARLVTGKGIDCYVLTDIGLEWLADGLIKYLSTHPLRIDECKNLPSSMRGEIHELIMKVRRNRGALGKKPALKRMMRTPAR